MYSFEYQRATDPQAAAAAVTADSDAKLRTSFEHPYAGSHQGQVLVVRDIDQAHHYRIIKYRPPIPIFFPFRVDRRFAALHPDLGDRCRRRLVVRAYHAGTGQRAHDQKDRPNQAPSSTSDRAPVRSNLKHSSYPYGFIKEGAYDGQGL